MSLQAITWAIAQEIASPGQKLLLICLANYADSDGTCFPGQKTLMADSSMKERTVRDHLAALEKSGFIERDKRYREDGTRTSDLYRLRINRQNLPLDETTGKNPSRLPAKIRHDYRQNLPGINQSVEPSEEHIRARAPKGLPTDSQLDAFLSAYPEGGRVNTARETVRMMLGKLAVTLDTSVEAITLAASVYASRLEKHKTAPFAVSRWLGQERELVRELLAENGPVSADGMTDEKWRSFVGFYQRRGDWRGPGPDPDSPDCKAPASILAAHGYGRAKELIAQK